VSTDRFRPAGPGARRDDVESTLREIVVRHSRLEVRDVRAEHTLADDLGFDSLSFVMTVSDLEEMFAVEFPIEKVDELRSLTFSGLVRLVCGRLAEAGAAPAGP
jgi:acyl carrier protein